MEKCLGLEVEGMVHIVRRGSRRISVVRKHASECIERPKFSELLPEICAIQPRYGLLWNQTIPRLVVLGDVVFVPVGVPNEIAPRVSAEELVSTRPGQDDLYELAGESSDVPIRIA